jgi:hypothetical protein
MFIKIVTGIMIVAFLSLVTGVPWDFFKFTLKKRMFILLIIFLILGICLYILYLTGEISALS